MLPSLVDLEEDIKTVTNHHDVYPAIDPQTHYDAQTFKDRVVLVTGASRGIGLEIALQYARAGAHLVLVGRQQETLDATRDAILREKAEAQVVIFVADVLDVQKAEAAVSAAVKRFGRLDILIANAGAVRAMGKPFAANDPTTWWNVFEVNVRGVYNYVHFAMPELVKTKGYVIVPTSSLAHLRIPTASSYCLSKFTMERLTEFIALENPEVKAFAVHPGNIMTQMYGELAGTMPKEMYEGFANAGGFPEMDTAALPAATILYLTSGKANYLSGRYVAATWDLPEVERDWKDKILAQNSLVNKLSIPQ